MMIPQANQILPEHPLPFLRTITPREETVGASSFVMTLRGNNFNRTSVVNFVGSPHPVLSSTPTELTVLILASDLGVAREVPVTVTNPPLGGGTSQAINFTIHAQGNPVPQVKSFDPRSVTATSGAPVIND